MSSSWTGYLYIHITMAPYLQNFSQSSSMLQLQIPNGNKGKIYTAGHRSSCCQVLEKLNANIEFFITSSIHNNGLTNWPKLSTLNNFWSYWPNYSHNSYEIEGKNLIYLLGENFPSSTLLRSVGLQYITHLSVVYLWTVSYCLWKVTWHTQTIKMERIETFEWENQKLCNKR